MNELDIEEEALVPITNLAKKFIPPCGCLLVMVAR
jgi:hypothetical protein